MIIFEFFAIFIPVLAIVLYSPLGKAWGESIFQKNRETDYLELKNRVVLLEKKLLDYESEMSQIRETMIFYDEKKQNPETQLKKPNPNLEKNL